MFCAKCGQQVDANQRFCPSCGGEAKVNNPPQQQQPQQARQVSVAPIVLGAIGLALFMGIGWLLGIIGLVISKKDAAAGKTKIGLGKGLSLAALLIGIIGFVVSIIIGVVYGAILFSSLGM